MDASNPAVKLRLTGVVPPLGRVTEGSDMTVPVPFRFCPRHLAAILLLAAILTAQAALAERQVYRLTFGGIRAGTITLETGTSEGRYAVSGEVEGGGLVGALFSFGFRGTAEGRVLPDGRLRPDSYAGVHKSNDRVRHTSMTFGDDAPATVEVTPARRRRPFDIDPVEQTGTVDPVTAAAIVLGPAPVDFACNRVVDIYDGQRRSRIRLAPPEKSGARWRCAGIYSRVAGYPAEELSERTDFPFALSLAEADGVLHVLGFGARSIYGPARAVRQ
jgi:hypothetical protein